MRKDSLTIFFCYNNLRRATEIGIDNASRCTNRAVGVNRAARVSKRMK